MSTRHRRVAIAIGLFAIAVALGSLAAPSRIGNVVAPPATVESGSPAADCQADCQDVLNAIRVPLQTLVAEGLLLAELGQSRSRNVVELTVRMDRYRTAAASIRELLGTLDVPPTIQATVNAIEAQVHLSLVAIDDSITAIRSFDWSALGLHVDAFAMAVNAIADLSDSIGISDTGVNT